MNPRCSRHKCLAGTLFAILALCSLASAQSHIPNALLQADTRDGITPHVSDNQPPDAPSAFYYSYSTSKDHGHIPETCRILTEANWRPLTAKEKFKSTSDDLLNPFTQMSLLANARFSQAIDDRPYLGPGAAGYFRRYGLDTADTANVDFMQGSLLPWLFKEDPRYIPKDSGSRKRRVLYAVSRVLITRKDNGGEGLNHSMLLGAFASSALSNAYYPDERNNGWHATTVRAASNIGTDAAMNILKEFWPDMAHKVKLNAWISSIVERTIRATTKEE